MTQTIAKVVNFDEFLAEKPEDKRYELHNGVIVEMPNPTGQHSKITGFLTIEFGWQIKQLKLPNYIPKDCTLKITDQWGYNPDVIVLDKEAVKLHESRWEKESVITQGTSVKLAVEVVSTNWRDDYGHKMVDYEKLGIPEYWIVDYLGLGGNRYIGTPKQPTLSIYQLVEGEYQIKLFRGDEKIESAAFPQLDLTAQQIFQGESI